MPKLLTFKHRKTLNQGFSTLEILVSIIIALAFVSVAMQTFVYAMAMKVQAQEKQRANQLIQEDMERTNVLASNIANVNICNSANYAGGYGQALWNSLNSSVPDSDPQLKIRLLKTAAGNPTGKTLRLKRNHVSEGISSSTFPHRTLKVNYQVWELDNSSNAVVDSTGNPIVIAERYVEVIPDVALQCP